MSTKAHGPDPPQPGHHHLGAGALIDLPHHSAIVGGLDTWPQTSDLDEIIEPRLTRQAPDADRRPAPRLYAPPPDSNDPREPKPGIGAWRFPEWFVVQEERRTRGTRAVAAARSPQGAGREGQVRRTRPVVADPLRARLPGATSTTSTGRLRPRRARTTAGGSSGSTSAAPAATSATSSSAASAGSRVLCTRRASSS